MPAFDKKRLTREIERDRRAKVKARVIELREAVKLARLERRAAIEQVRTQCRVAREKLRTQCGRRVEAARVQGSATILDRARALLEEREQDRIIRDADRRHARGVVKARSSSAERRQESDDEVRANLPDGLVAVFDSVRRHIRPAPRKSRTETFLQWAEENPGEVYAIQSSAAERELARLIAEQERAERLARKRGRLAAGDVPF